MKVTCAVCGKVELVYPSRAKRYKACSRSCAAKLSSANLSENVTAECEVCGTIYKTKKSHLYRRRTCSKSCLALLKSVEMEGESNHQYGRRGEDRGMAFKGGRRISTWGYVLIYVSTNRYEFEHRLVMEKSIGRKLEHDEHVHHINGNKQDNRMDNLQVLSKSEHQRIHAIKNPQPRDKITQQFVKGTKQ